MKKMAIFTTLLGIVAGVVYWIYKKEKFNSNQNAKEEKKEKFDGGSKEEDISEKSKIIDETYQTKLESVKDIHERHSEASDIMIDAYSNIMENFVEDFTNEENASEIIITEVDEVSVMKEIEEISNNLDDLLK